MCLLREVATICCVVVTNIVHRYQAALAAKKGKSSGGQGSRAPPQYTNPKQVE